MLCNKLIESGKKKITIKDTPELVTLTSGSELSLKEDFDNKTSSLMQLDIQEPIKDDSQEKGHTKAYNTRNVNKRYSLDTIVVDDSYTNSGIYNYQTSNVKIDRLKTKTKYTKRSNATKRLSLKSQTLTEKSTKQKLKPINTKQNENIKQENKTINLKTNQIIDLKTNQIIDLKTDNIDKTIDKTINQKVTNDIKNDENISKTNIQLISDAVICCLCKIKEDDGLMVQVF